MTVDESEDGKEEADERMDMVEDGEKDWWKTAAVAAAAVGAAVSPGAWDYAAAWRAQLLAFFSFTEKGLMRRDPVCANS